MKRPLKTIFGLLIAGGVIVGLIFAFREMSQERAREQEREKPVAAPTRVSRSPQGEIILTLDAETQKRIGLAVAPLSAAEHRATRQGFARVLDATSLTSLLNELALARTNQAASEKELARAKVLAAQTNLSEKALLAAENTAGRDRLAVQAAEDKLALAFGRELANRADLLQLSRSLASLEAALVRVDLSAGEILPTPPTKARLFAPANEDADSFKWSSVIEMIKGDFNESMGLPHVWDAQQNFVDPKNIPTPLGAWEKYAQVLLLSNEFVFVE